jgi:hypothetical protein
MGHQTCTNHRRPPTDVIGRFLALGTRIHVRHTPQRCSSKTTLQSETAACPSTFPSTPVGWTLSNNQLDSGSDQHKQALISSKLQPPGPTRCPSTWRCSLLTEPRSIARSSTCMSNHRHPNRFSHRRPNHSASPLAVAYNSISPELPAVLP